MLTKQCNRCRTIIPFGASYCDECKPVVSSQREELKEKRNKKYDQGQRDKRSTAFYNSQAWKMLSRTRLQDDKYRCQKCGGMATEVHHKIPIKVDWSKRFDIDNLESLCTRCHNSVRE